MIDLDANGKFDDFYHFYTKNYKKLKINFANIL